MITEDRTNTVYDGQTILHMAVTKRKKRVVKTLLEADKVQQHKQKLLQGLATGDIFMNTVTMAQLPLSIAAVTGRRGIFDLLQQHKAELDATNTYGDNVCHSLIRYAYVYPDKLDKVKKMCKHISKNIATDEMVKKIWLMENNTGYSPLQLAAKFGQHEIFRFIMKLNVYCRQNINGGLFDIQIFDVTELDAISYMKLEERTGIKRDKTIKSIEGMPRRKAVSRESRSCLVSTLQMLYLLEPGCAFQFLLFSPLSRIIDAKWATYRWLFYPWFIVHVLHVCFLTWYGIERAQQFNNTGFDINKNPNYKRNMFHDGFGIAYGTIGVCIGTTYLFEAILRRFMGRMPFNIRSFTNPYGNGTFEILFVLFGLTLLIDFPFAIWVRSYENYLLMLSIIFGWFLILFFLRALRPFSFFTVMIQKVLIGDLFRFSVILSLELVGFSTIVYMAIQGSTELDPEFDDYWKVVVSMFKLMIGIGDMGIMYKARHPVLVVLIFVIFIVFTAILMINSLIAMVSRTCTDLVEKAGSFSAHDMHCELQKLSVILHLESILPRCALTCVGKPTKISRYSSQINKSCQVTRYMLEIRSLQNENDITKHDTDSLFQVPHFRKMLRSWQRSNRLRDQSATETHTSHNNGRISQNITKEQIQKNNIGRFDQGLNEPVQSAT